MTGRNKESRGERWKDFASLLFLAISALYCTLPLFIHKTLPYAQDIVFHVFQAEQFTQSLREGLIYPRWVLDSNNGYGSANFVFYAPLGYYFVSAISLFLSSVIFSLIVSVWFSFFLAGATMFTAAKRVFGRSGSLLSAALYQILPFHLNDLYVRGTFAELFAFVWFPLIFLFLHDIFQERNKAAPILGLSFSYAGLVLTHLVSGFIFSVIIGFYLVLRLFSENKKPFIRAIWALILGLGVSSFYLLPVIFERSYVQIDFITKCAIGDYRKNFLFTLDKFQGHLRSFYLPLHWGIAFEVFLFGVILWLLREKGRKARIGFERSFSIFAFLAALILTSPLSRPIWDHVPGFPTLQFPWRWVTVMEVSLSFLIGGVFTVIETTNIRSAFGKKPHIFFFTLILVFVLISFGTISGSKMISEDTLRGFLTSGQLKQIVDPPMEYTPIWAENIKEILSEKGNERVSVVEGRAIVRVVEWKAEKRIFAVEASDPSLLKISTFYYPGWEADLDGKPLSLGIERGTGAMLVNVPEGRHELQLKFADTPLRYCSKLFSVLTMITIAFFLFIKRR